LLSKDFVFFSDSFGPFLKARIISSENTFTFFINNIFRGFGMDKIQLRDFVSLIETSLVTINGVDNFFAPLVW